MVNKLKALASIFLITLLTGCGLQQIKHDYSLTDVEYPKDSDRQEQVKPKTQNDYRFANEDIDISWRVGLDRLAFTLENKTDSTIHIIWNEAAYVDINKKSHRIMHEGVKFIDRNGNQPNTAIIRGTRIDELLIPTDHVTYENNKWRIAPLLPFRFRKDIAKYYADIYDGSKIKVLLPLKINDRVDEYIFEFKVNSTLISQQ